MAEKKKSAKKTSAKKKAPSKKPATPKKKVTKDSEPTFPDALAAVLRKRKLKVPSGLTDAPPEAYARQPASFVDTLAQLDDDRLAAQAEKIASHAKRQEERIRKTWDESALIREIRKRKLKAPDPPQRVVGAAFSFKKPLPEWTDAELLDAARQWSERGRA